MLVRPVSRFTSRAPTQVYSQQPAGTKTTRSRRGPAPPSEAPTLANKLVVDELGWSCVPPGLIYRDLGSTPSTKVAAFDLASREDGTLLTTRSGARFARGASDWVFLTPRVPAVLQQLVADGYRIVVFTNQGGVRTALSGKLATSIKVKVEDMLRQAGVPALVVMATAKDQYRKPSPGMWHLLCSKLSGGVTPDPELSFYVGDAAGRATDFIDTSTGAPSAVDRQFAANVGITFRVPEDVFG